MRKKTSERRWEKLERCGQIKMWTKKKENDLKTSERRWEKKKKDVDK